MLMPVEFHKLLLVEKSRSPATMIHVCVHSAVRVSELISLRWQDMGAESLTGPDRDPWPG